MNLHSIFLRISVLAILVLSIVSLSATSHLNDEDPEYPGIAGYNGIMILGENKPPEYFPGYYASFCACAINLRDSDNEHGGFIGGLTDCSGLVSGKAQRVNVQSALNVVLIQITIGGQLFQNTNHGLKNSARYLFTSAENPYNSFTLTTGHNAETPLEGLERDAHIKKKLEATLGIETAEVANFWSHSINPAEKSNGFTPMKDLRKHGRGFPGLYAFWYDPKKKLFYLSIVDNGLMTRDAKEYGSQTIIFHKYIRVTLGQSFSPDCPIHQVVFRVK